MSASTISIDELVRLLRGLKPSQLEAQHIEELLTGASLDHATLAPYLFRRQHCYTRNLIFRNDRFEMLALVWEPGACSAIHDHAGQECFFSVQQGSFQQEDFHVVIDGEKPGQAVLVGVPQRMTLTPGKVDHRVPQSPLHRILNVGNEGGISLHVYARPIDSCLIYDVRQKWCQRRTMVYDSVQGKALREGLFHMNPRCTGVPVPLVSH